MAVCEKHGEWNDNCLKECPTCSVEKAEHIAEEVLRDVEIEIENLEWDGK